MTYSLATIRTQFELLRSTIAPEVLVGAAQRYSMEAVGVVDRSTLAHVRLAQAAHEAGLHVVYGATLVMAGGLPLRILARNQLGYRSLCRLVSLQAYGRAPLADAALRDEHAGLYILCGGRQGRLWHALAQGDERALWTLARLQALAEHEEQFVVECQQSPADSDADIRTLQRLLDLAKRAGARCMATQDVSMLLPEDRSRHRLVHAIGQATTFWSDDAGLPAWSAPAADRYALPTPQAWQRQWSGLEHLTAGSTVVMRDCQVELLGPRRFPGASLPALDVYDALWKRSFAGVRQRYGQLTPELMTRLHHEIDQVAAQGVAPFLLNGAELVERAAARGLRMILQGSGTGSLICYALGISSVDPLAVGEGLVFERFAGTHRGAGDVPDLDFGIPAGREEELRAILREMFGPERVAHLAAVVTFREQGALRHAAQALGWDDHDLAVLSRKVQEGAALDRQEQMVVNAAATLEGQPDHLMQHASGMVMTDEPVRDVWGVGSASDGSAMILADKDDCEALQVLKFDFLSWYGLTIFEQAATTIQATYDPVPELWNVPVEDARTAELLQHADTLAIPFLQSPACRLLLRSLKTTTEADIALCLGALRPGASTTRERLLAAIHGGPAKLAGWELFSPEHQAVITRVLAPSKGALIFDEDLLRLAHAVGFSFADAERLRKVLGRGATTGPLLNQFRATGLDNGWTDGEIDTMLYWFTYMERYTYLRGHAVAMAHLGWRLARLQVSYPAHFYAAALDNLGTEDGGMYPILVYATEARRKGLTLHGPSVNGPWHSRPDGQAIQGGLVLLSGTISEEALQCIHTEAQRRPFASLPDLRARVSLRERELQQLLGSGALDEFIPDRRQARWELRLATPGQRDQNSLFGEMEEAPRVDVAREPLRERVQEENAVLGFPVSAAHPLMLYQTVLSEHDVVLAEQLGDFVHQQVTVAGVVVAHRTIRTTQGSLMAFGSLCDPSGTLELTVGEAVLASATAALHTGTVLLATGRVSYNVERGLGLDVDWLIPLRLPS